MNPRTSRTAPSFQALALAASLVAMSCEKVPLTAPTGSTIVLTAGTNVLALNGTADIIATLLEAAGTPPHSGTVISFTTTLGSIEPADAHTDTSGRVIVKFRAGTSNGTAAISATSGGATTGTNGVIRIAVGTAAVGRVTVNASPATVPNTGGSTTVTANVFDINGNPLPSAPVSFTTTAGVLSQTLVNTGADGSASATLTTSQAATVTASVGATAPSTGGGGGTGGGGTGGGGTGGGGTTTPAPAPTGQASGSVTVNVSIAPILVITPPATPPSVGLPAVFTFEVTVAATNGIAVKNLRVDWGDGEARDLGAVTGKSIQSHVYRDDKTYIVVGTLTDAANNTATVTASVTVIPVGSPTIIITPSVPLTSTLGVPVNVTFRIEVTPPTGVSILSAVINFGHTIPPPATQELGGLTGTTTVSHPYPPEEKGAKTVIVTVTDSIGRNTAGSVSINVP